jgi:serine phosphatase RsbU (regulator of sigma subunit)
VVAFVVGNVAVSAIVRAVRGDRRELEWISDAVVSAAVIGMTYLWLHLKASRMRVLALEREQIVLDEQLRLAAEIQRNLLPDLPPATPGFRWAARMVPAGWVGGDFYDFVQPATGVALAILGDVSGKGIPAALIQSSLKALFRLIVRDTTDPAAIAERLAAELHEQTSGMPYATAIVARFESAPNRLAYVNAGHPSGYLLRDGSAGALPSGGPPLGLLPETRYASTGVDLRPGDVGVLVTDGITEALEGVPTTVSEALRAQRDDSLARRSPTEICDHLLRAAGRGPGPVGVDGWQDDRTVFVFAVETGAKRG